MIGRRPVMAFGNSDGVKAMLEYTTIGNPRPSLGLIVQHTDAEREYVYNASPKGSGKLIDAVADAPKLGWTVVDMKRDWKDVLADDSVTAIDVLLESDAWMLRRAATANARLLEAYPQGFPLDAGHRPHFTLIQYFARTSDLDKVYAATEKVLAGFDLKSMKLEAIKQYYIPNGDNGVAGIVIRPTPDLIKLQQNLIDAVAPFRVETATSNAFVTTPDDLIIKPSLIEYVSAFVSKSTGESFNPHVTTGVAPKTFLDEMLKDPFDSFSFAPSSAAVYQLDQYGTAAKKLKEWSYRP
jgi:hypothetical protein